jgi:hypothetical protein
MLAGSPKKSEFKSEVANPVKLVTLKVFIRDGVYDRRHRISDQTRKIEPDAKLIEHAGVTEKSGENFQFTV